MLIKKLLNIQGSNKGSDILNVKGIKNTLLKVADNITGNIFSFRNRNGDELLNIKNDGVYLPNVEDSIDASFKALTVDTTGKVVRRLITSGTGGFAGQVYLTNQDSTTVSGYKQLSYEDDATATVLATVSDDNEVLVQEYIFDVQLDTALIPSGLWEFNYFAKSNATQGIATIRSEVFVRATNGVETVLFSKSTNDINNNGFERVITQVTEEKYDVNPTDELGVKVYVSTTRTSPVTIEYQVGNGDASYLTTPISILHENLRGRDRNDQHPISAITGLETNLSDKQDEIDLNSAARHTHPNKPVLDNFGEDANGDPTYNGVKVDTTIAQRDVYDGLDSTDNTISLSANQGRVLNINKAEDSEVVKLTTNQSISGEKTFNDNLGINTSTPRTKLHAVGDNPSSLPSLGTAGSAASIGQFSYGTQFSTLSNGKGYIQQSRTDGSTSVYDLLLQPQGGNVGIGGDNPAEKLTIIDGGIILGTSTTNQPNTSYIRFTEYDTDNIQGSFMHYDGSANLLHLGMHPTSDNVVGNDINAITIRRDNRNVGIGTTNPSSKLEVNGDIEVNSNNYFKAGDTWIRDNGAGISVISQNDLGGGSIFFRPNGDSSSVNEMTLDSSGNLVVDGTADFMFRSNTYYGNAANNPMIYFGASTNSNAIIHRASGTNQNFNWRSSSNNVVATLDADNGDFETDGDVIAFSSSDKNLKENIVNINSPVDKIKKLNGVYFDWIESDERHNHKGKDVGVIAQEVEKVLPEIVTTRKNGVKAVQYDKLIPLAIEAIKEQDKKIEDLETRLEKLEKLIK